MVVVARKMNKACGAWPTSRPQPGGANTVQTHDVHFVPSAMNEVFPVPVCVGLGTFEGT